MRWKPGEPGLSPPLTQRDQFLDALAAQVELLEETITAQAADIAALKAKAGLP